MRKPLLALLACSASACSTVETRPLGYAQPSGIAYQLPLGKMRLRVVETAGVVSVLLDGPLVTGDPDHQLVAHLPQSGVADNNVTVTVDGKTNLLSKVEVTSTGRLTEILTAATKSVVFLQSSDGTEGTTLFAGVYAVDDLPNAAAQANTKLAEYYTKLCGPAVAGKAFPFSAQLKKVGRAEDAEKTAARERLLRCRTMSEAGVDMADQNGGLIRIEVAAPSAGSVLPGFTGARSVKVEDTEACARGICYRPYRPRAVTLDVKGAFRLSDVFLIPDPNALVHVALPSGVTAEQKYTLDFTDGVLTKYQRDGKSELVGFASLPFKVVEATLSAPAQALGLKQKNVEASTSYLEAVGKLAAQQKAAREACDDPAKAASCPETAYKLIGGRLVTEAQDKPKPAGDSDVPAGGNGDAPADEG